MRILMTGGAGFVGGAVVRQLRARGDEVVAAVRDPERAGGMAALGCRLVRSDLSSTVELAGLMAGADAVIHAAGSYHLGLPARDRPAMEESNVGATTRVLDAAITAGARRIVYVSTIGVYGDTHGAVVDETYRRDLSAGFLSWYDETKYRAHRIADDRIAAGAPIVIGLPGQVYGPGDHSAAARSCTTPSAGGCATSRSATPAPLRSMWTTWRPACWNASIGVASASHTTWAVIRCASWSASRRPPDSEAVGSPD